MDFVSQVTSYNKEKRRYRVQFFDSEVNLLSVPEAGIEDFHDSDELRGTIPQKYMGEWSRGMENAAKALAMSLDESA